MDEPVASTSRAVAQDDETPMIPDEDEQQINVSDLFSAEDLIDRLVGAVSKGDVAACLFYIRQLELRKALDRVNEPRKSRRPASSRASEHRQLRTVSDISPMLYRLFDEPDGARRSCEQGTDSGRSAPRPHPRPQRRQAPRSERKGDMADGSSDLGDHADGRADRGRV